MEKEQYHQKLSKKEKKAKDFIELAFKCHEEEWLDTAKRLMDFYKGKYYFGQSKRNRFTVNSIFSIVNLFIPNLTFHDPYIKVSPLQSQYFKKLIDGEYLQIDNVYAAMVREAAINYDFKRLSIIEEQRKAIQDALFYGFGLTKIGYSFDTISNTDFDYVLKDSPFVKRVCPKDFGWHPMATSLDDSPLLVHRVMDTKNNLKKNKTYSDLLSKIDVGVPEHIKKKLKAGKHSVIDDYDYVTLYEVHDQEEETIYLFGGEDKKILLDKRKNKYEFSGSHFDMIKFAGDNDEFLGESLLAKVEDGAVAMNEIMTALTGHLRKFPSMVMVEEGSMDQDQIDRFENSEQGSIQQIKNIDKVRFNNPLSMGTDYANSLNLISTLMDRILGVPDFQRLVGSGGRRSATESSFIQGDSTVRREFFLKKTKAFILASVEKLAKLQEQFQDEEKEITASGDLKGMVFNYSKEDLKGEYKFDFDLDTLRAFNSEQAQSINSALNILGAHEVLHPVLKTLSPEKLGKELFKKMGLNIESFKENSLEPMAVFVTPEKENEMARNDLPMPNPKIGEDHEYHIEKHSEDLRLNGPSEAILRHLAETIMLQKREKGETMMPPESQQPQGMGGPPVAGQPVPPMQQGPAGPMQAPMTEQPQSIPPGATVQ